MKQRDVSIDILKCLAVLLIVNSHMDVMYTKLGALATGGAIGDALFFFASGFTILLGGVKSFDNYYKRRINRIYPTVLAWATLSCLILHNDQNMVNILLTGGGAFVSSIMVYYVLLYFIRKYLIDHLTVTLIAAAVLIIPLYAVFSGEPGYNIYGSTQYKWCFFFLFMLQGAILGVRSQQRQVEIRNGWIELAKLMGCVVLFYVFSYFKKSDEYNWLQVCSLLPLLGTTYYVYRLCNVAAVKRLYYHRIAGWTVKAIGGLCLEVYLVNMHIINDKLNGIFPLNLLVVFLAILVAAYILRCLGRIWSQTFKETDYEWKKVFAII